ncbi:MAG: hypothetical protein J0I87_05570, partial [Cellulomonas sp.]|nr:hypothetical protein [Cellulomonas sp.]
MPRSSPRSGRRWTPSRRPRTGVAGGGSGPRRAGAIAASVWLVGVAVTGLIASRAVAVLDTDT